MKKFQQGGVQVFNIPNTPAPNVGQNNPSPVINTPNLPILNIPALANLSQQRYMRQRQYEADRLRQQKQLEGDQETFYTLKDSLFGTVHNPYQEKLINAAKDKYGIDEDYLANMDTNNLAALKQQTDKLYKAAHDPGVIKALGQIQAADYYFTHVPQGLTPEQQEQYGELKKQYQTSTEDFDVTQLNGNLLKTKTEKPPNEKNLTGVIFSRAEKGGLDVDWTNQDEVDNYAWLTMNDWWMADSYSAAKKGYIVTDENGNNPQLTPAGYKFAVETGMQVTGQKSALRDQKMADAKELIKDRALHSPSNKSKTKKLGTNETEAAYDEALAAWNDLLTNPTFDEKYGYFDIENDPRAPAIRSKLRALTTDKGNATKVSQSEIERIFRDGESQLLVPQRELTGAQEKPTGQVVIPEVTPIVAPPVPTKTVLDPATGKVSTVPK